MNASRLSVRSVVAALFAIAMALVGGCGGSSDSPPPVPVTPTIGAAGGTVSGPNGAQVVLPANALSRPTAIVVAQDAAGAPPLPAGQADAGAIYSLTPHGTTFAQPVALTVPFDASKVPAGVTPVLLKTNAARTAWEPVPGATVSGTTMTGQIASFSFTIVVVPASPPTITSQPADQAVTAPATATFVVGATGLTSAGVLQYQWKRNGAAIAGATAPNYTTGPTSVASDNGATYSVDVTNTAGTVTSRAALLTVTAAAVAPVITTEPADQSVTVGATATFAVTATGTALTYQWQRSNDGGATFANIGGAIAATYTTAATATGDNNARFRVVVSNSVGAVQSRAAVLTVNAATSAPPPVVLAGGDQYSLAIQVNGTVLAWGRHGLGLPTAGPAPVTVPNIADALSVSASSHALVLRSTDGSVWGWGYNGFGQLGDQAGPCMGDCPTRSSPVRAGTLTNVIGISAGGLHSLAVRADGTVWAWGYNANGQLGDGTTTTRTQPTQVPGLTGVRMVAAGNQFSLALKSDGTVWAWGANASGQLGDGTTTERHSPVQVGGLTQTLSIVSGSDHAIALVPGGVSGFGTAYIWGDNSAGQLGTGTGSGSRVPVPLSGVLSQVAAGALHSALLYFDSVVFTMGRNAEGQLGDGTTTNRNQPTFVASIDCDAIAAGSSHMLCVKHGTREVWAWGSNGGGQLGDGTTTNRSTAVRAAGVLVR
jgi:alpha-tubulin suppressor-like RCC1 family protein